MTDSDQIQPVGQRFVSAFADRDFARVQACFDREAKFRALIPPGVCEAADAAGATSHLHEWFGGADHFEILSSELGTVVDRLRIAYQLRVHDADGWQVFEQQAYCDVRDGKITAMDLLCSGPRVDPVVPGNGPS
jgi:hypothetical protein